MLSSVPPSAHQSTMLSSVPSSAHQSTMLSSVPSSAHQSTMPSSVPSSERQSTMLSTVPSSERQRSGAFKLPHCQGTNVAVSLPELPRNDVAMSSTFSLSQGHNSVPPSSHQLNSPPMVPVLPPYQSTSASLHREARPTLLSTQQSCSPSQVNVQPKHSINSVSLKTSSGCNRLSSTPFSTMSCTSSTLSKCAPVPASSGHASTQQRGSNGVTSTPQSSSVANSNEQGSTLPHVNNVTVTAPATSLVRNPQTFIASPTLQQETALSQDGSPPWDTATLSLLSDLFAPQPSQRQRHLSESKYPQTSVALPSVGGGDRLISELLDGCQNQSSVAVCAQPSVSLPSVDGDANSIINDLLGNSQSHTFLPKCPQNFASQPSKGGGQGVKEVLSSQSASLSTAKKQPAVSLQSLVNGQRSNSSVTHPLMRRVSSPSTNNPLPRQQNIGSSLTLQQQNVPLLQQCQQNRLPQNTQLSWQHTQRQHCQQPNIELPQQRHNGPISQPQHSGPLSQNGLLPQLQQKLLLSQSSPLLQHQCNGPLPQQQNVQLRSHQENKQSGPLLQDQRNYGLKSQDGLMFWPREGVLSTNHSAYPQSHQASPRTNVNCSSPVSTANMLRPLQLGGLQVSPSSSTCVPSPMIQHQQQLLSPTQQQSSLPSLPKLTPLPSQTTTLGSHQQAPPTISTHHNHPTTAATRTQEVRFRGCVTTGNSTSMCTPISGASMSISPQPEGMDSTRSTQNLLSILNSLSPSQLESLLSSNTKDSPAQMGNGRQTTMPSGIGTAQLSVSHSQTNFHHPSFGSPIPPSSYSTPATDYRESVVSQFIHQRKPKVTQVNKTTASAPSPHFTVRSSCTSTELSRQLPQSEPTAAVIGYANGLAGSVSAFRLHS